MTAVIGRDEAGSPVRIDFRSALHVVLAGATRSGKSVASYSILSAAAADPAVEVAGIDPSGILLAPHVRGDGDWRMSLGTANPASAVEVGDRLVRVMDARNRYLLERGVDKVPDNAFGPRFPIILVVLEEYAGTLEWLKSDDAANRTKNEPAMRAHIGRLLREGAKAGIRVLTILQRPEAAVLHDRAQYSRRIAFRLDNADSVKMLHEGASPEEVQRLMNVQPGVGIIHEAGDSRRFFRAPLMEYGEYRQKVLEARP